MVIANSQSDLSGHWDPLNQIYIVDTLENYRHQHCFLNPQSVLTRTSNKASEIGTALGVDMRSIIAGFVFIIGVQAQAMIVDTVCYKPDVIHQDLGIGIMIKTNNMNQDYRASFRGALVDFVFASSSASEHEKDMSRLGQNGELLRNSGILDQNAPSQMFYSELDAQVGLDLSSVQIVTEKDLLSNFNGGQIGKYEIRALFVDDVATTNALDLKDQFGRKMIEVKFSPEDC
jgi:hypothetical protein